VVGIGNFLRGDDGIGLAVARGVHRRELPHGVGVIEHQGDPVALLERWASADAVVIVDAVRSGSTPGTITRFDSSSTPLPARFAPACSSHAAGLAETIELGRALGRLPRRVIVYAVEGEQFDAGAALGEGVARVLEQAVDAVHAEASELASPRVAIFGPDLLLSVTIEARGGEDDVHVHAAGQGVWVARMAAELGGWPILCCFYGGETGTALRPLVDALPGERRLVPTSGTTGSYVIDRRGGERQVLACALRQAPARHEVDDLVAATCAAASSSRVLVVCNPYPATGLHDEVYETIVANARAGGAQVVVDLSSPRLDHALVHGPELVKLNDWELAEYVRGPVDGPLALEAAKRLRDAGAQAVAVTRAGDPILVLAGDEDPFEIVPPRFPRGHREGCGDAMTGAIAAALARGASLRDALVLGAAAGSGNFLRHGLGTGRRAVVEELAGVIEVRPLSTTA
jgi:1-phosphofructokinase